MLLAFNSTKNLVRPTPKMTAYCPCCDGKVLAKTGMINVWHWAHESRTDCDSWGEPETHWHLHWKELFGLEYCEKVMGNHRADVVWENRVIELQNSPISWDVIRERELFYGKMIWIVNKKTLGKGFHVYNNENEKFFRFRWDHPRKSFWGCNQPIMMDYGYGFLFWIKRMNKGLPCRGWGKWIYYTDKPTTGFNEYPKKTMEKNWSKWANELRYMTAESLYSVIPEPEDLI